MNKYGTVIEQLAPVRVLGKKKMLFFVWFYFGRRGLIPVIIMTLYNYPVVQITSILSLQLFYMIFIMNTRVFSSRSE